MSDFEKKVGLIEVDVDYSSSKKAVAEFTESIVKQKDTIASNNAEIKALNKANSDLQKEVKKGNKSFDEANKEIQENTQRVTSLKKENAFLGDEIKDLNKERSNAVKATKLQSNSLDALKKKVKEQKEELGSLNIETKEGKKRFDELKDEIEENVDQIAELEKGTGGFRDALASTGGGVKIFGNSIGDLWNMLKANPIILIVSALAGLIGMFKNSQTGAEFFRKTGAALNTVFGKLADVVEMLGGKLIDAFNNPKQALDDLVSAIKDGIVNYFTKVIPNAIDNVIEGFGLLGKAVKQIFEGDFSGALATAKEGTVQLLDGVTDLNPAIYAMKEGVKAAIPAIKEFAKDVQAASSSAYDLEQQMIAVEKAIADQEVAVAKSIARQKELKLTVDDQSKSYDERIAAAEEFARVEAEQIETSLKLAKEKVDILKAQNDLTNSTEEDIQKVRDAEIQLANLRAASDSRLLENQTKLISIRKAQDTETEKLQAAQLARQEALNAKLIELEKFRRDQANKERIAEIEDIKGQLEAKRELAIEDFEMKLARMEEEKEALNEIKDIEEEEKLLRQAEFDLQIEELKAGHKDRMVELTSQQATEELKIEEEKEKERQKIASTGQNIIQGIISTSNSKISARYQKRFADLEKQFESGAITEEEYARRKEKLEQNQAIAQWKAEKTEFQINKAASIAKILSNLFVANSKGIAFSPLTAGEPWNTINRGILFAQLGRVATQKAPPRPSFALGGDVMSFLAGGKDHSAGGTSYFGEDGNSFNVQRGEGIFVTKREATNPALHALDQANTAFGGRSMFASSARFLQEGGSVNQSAPSITPEMLIDAIANLPVPVVDIETIMGGIQASEGAKKVGRV